MRRRLLGGAQVVRRGIQHGRADRSAVATRQTLQMSVPATASNRPQQSKPVTTTLGHPPSGDDDVARPALVGALLLQPLRRAAGRVGVQRAAQLRARVLCGSERAGASAPDVIRRPQADWTGASGRAHAGRAAAGAAGEAVVAAEGAAEHVRRRPAGCCCGGERTVAPEQHELAAGRDLGGADRVEDNLRLGGQVTDGLAYLPMGGCAVPGV